MISTPEEVAESYNENRPEKLKRVSDILKRKRDQHFVFIGLFCFLSVGAFFALIYISWIFILAALPIVMLLIGQIQWYISYGKAIKDINRKS